MPTPVSGTETSTSPSFGFAAISIRPPSGVNLIAFDRRFRTTWRTFRSTEPSPPVENVRTVLAVSSLSDFALHLGCNISGTLRDKSSRSKKLGRKNPTSRPVYPQYARVKQGLREHGLQCGL